MNLNQKDKEDLVELKTIMKGVNARLKNIDDKMLVQNGRIGKSETNIALNENQVSSLIAAVDKLKGIVSDHLTYEDRFSREKIFKWGIFWAGSFVTLATAILIAFLNFKLNN